LKFWWASLVKWLSPKLCHNINKEQKTSEKGQNSDKMICIVQCSRNDSFSLVLCRPVKWWKMERMKFCSPSFNARCSLISLSQTFVFLWYLKYQSNCNCSKELFTYFYRENIHFIMKARFIENKKVNLLFLIYIMYMVFH